MEGGIPTAAAARPPMAGDGKPPLSSLKGRAPAPLQIDPPAIPISRETVFSCVPIPLLSPLVLTPERPPADHGVDTKVPGNEEGDAVECVGEQGEAGSGPASTPPAGWQHPAVPAVAEPASLPSLFQAQCMLASHAQRLT